MRTFFALSFLLVALLGMSHTVSAHEVYVLSPDTIAHDRSTPSPDPLGSFFDNQGQFFLWAFIGFVLVSTVFFASITHRLELFFEPYLTPLRRWAPLVARLTLGTCLLLSAQNYALFGPELPLQAGVWGQVVFWGLVLSGMCILFGFATRVAALLALAVFAVGYAQWGVYMLNYANYLGEMLVVLILGGGLLSFDHLLVRQNLSQKLERYAFLALRVGFGVAVAFAAIYAKFIHSNLALSTIAQYQLTTYFHFDPLFIVLGAGIIEVVMGIFFIIGFEIRHTALFFLFWLCLSLLYFGESVWPHLVLFGVNAALFMYGYDKWTVEGRFFNRGKLQPFL